MNKKFVVPAAAGEVQVRDATLNIVEGNIMDFCAVLTGTTGSPTSLPNSLTVMFSIMETGNAGMHLFFEKSINSEEVQQTQQKLSILATHTQGGLQCTVCQSVCYHVFSYCMQWDNKTAIQTGFLLILKRAFVKLLYSKVMV